MRSKNEQTLNNILKLINDCYFESGVYPTFQQIATAVGLSVPQTYRYVDELIKRGDLEKNGRYGDLQTKEIVNSLCSHNRLPIVGEVACGTPILAEENIECDVTFSRELLGNGQFFILRAKGDSMINARIHDGDIVFVKKTDIVENGEIAVVIIDDEATLKRFFYYREQNLVILKPENPKYQDIILTGEQLNQVRVIGRAVAFQSDVI